MKNFIFIQRLACRKFSAGKSLRVVWLFVFSSCCIFNSAFAQVRVCPGTCTDFINFFANATSFQWTFAGAIPSTSTDENPTNICYNTPGNYDVTLIATDSAGSDTILLNNYVTVYPFPPPQGMQQNGDTLFANQGATSYQWYLNGSPIPAATNYFYVGNVSGEYNLVATDSNGCEVETASWGIIYLSILKPDYENEIAIFPNPVKDKLTMHSRWLSGARCTIGTAVDVSIYNLVGEKVLMAANCLPIAIGMRTVDCRLLPPGIYYLEITNGSKTLRTKFIKQ